MAHFAKLDDNNVVLEVTVVSNVDIHFLPFPESEAFGVKICRDVTGHQKWKQTSYNSNFRNTFAGTDYIYDSANDVFYEPKPCESWVLNTTTWLWDAPLTYPTDGNMYIWDEDAYQADNTTGWVKIS